MPEVIYIPILYFSMAVLVGFQVFERTPPEERTGVIMESIVCGILWPYVLCAGLRDWWKSR